MKKKMKTLMFLATAMLILMGTESCKKESEKDNTSTTPSANVMLPTLTTATIGNITSTTASGGGSIISSGSGSVMSRGVCWSVNSMPTVDDSTASNGVGNGFFTVNLSGLTSATTYYVRAFAINSAGTAYGNQVVFTTF